MCGFGDKVGCRCLLSKNAKKQWLIYGKRTGGPSLRLRVSVSSSLILRRVGKLTASTFFFNANRSTPWPSCLLTRTFDSDVDHAMFVLNVDLWSADGAREVNLVRSSSSSASSAAQNTTSPIGNAPDPSMSHYSQAHAAAANRDPAYGQHAAGYQDYPAQHGYSMGKSESKGPRHNAVGG